LKSPEEEAKLILYIAGRTIGNWGNIVSQPNAYALLKRNILPVENGRKEKSQLKA
jgi:hypothetical protein